jgi:hypothetical protein
LFVAHNDTTTEHRDIELGRIDRPRPTWLFRMLPIESASRGEGVLLGLLLCIVFSLDHPFGSERGITPAPFQHALQVFDAIDLGK